jgi:hypothetical protein
MYLHTVKAWLSAKNMTAIAPENIIEINCRVTAYPISGLIE